MDGRTPNAIGNDESAHVPVLLHETVEALIGDRSGAAAQPQPPSGSYDAGAPWYLDGTLGGAGHAKAIAKALNGRVNMIGLDRDPSAIERARRALPAALAPGRELILEVANFRDLDKVLERRGMQPTGSLDMALFDLGLSSDELESSGKGFTFQKDEPLLMTMGDPAAHPFTARDIVNGWAEDDIANVIYAYGEERFARRIARAIVRYREKKAIETTAELAELVRAAVPPIARHRKTHPATKTFQALRIAVNDELKAIEQGLEKGYAALRPGGRLVVISFHSLEDRIVKAFMRARGSKAKPVKPSDAEVAANPRARSAKLRMIAKA